MNAIETTRSPLIGPAEQRLFAIKETRKRADRLQEQLVPKLKSILDKACDLIREIYGEDVLSPYRIRTTPAHRTTAKKTKPFEVATACLYVKGSAPHSFFGQQLNCTSNGISVSLRAVRRRVADPLVQVMTRHSAEVIRLLELVECKVFSDAVEPLVEPLDETEYLAPTEFIRKLLLAREQKRDVVLVKGSYMDIHIEDLDVAWPMLNDFVALFPIYRASTHLFQGEKDRFPYYAERFWAWHDRLSDGGDGEDSDDDNYSLPEEVPLTAKLIEGTTKSVLVNAYERSPEARRQCIEHHGTSCCICGFCFGTTFGEEADGFIHVHHLRPLSEIGEEYVVDPRADLRPVYPNCHAFIHLGGRCRTIKEVKRFLAKQRSVNESK